MKKILLVEDNETITMGLKYSLEQENFEVETAKNVVTAKAKMKKEEFNMYLLDIALPDGEGYELCKEIKEKGNKPVIFLTAKDKEEDVIKAFNLGADDYIVKPFRIGELTARIKNALRKYKQEEGIIKIENIVFNLDKMNAFKKNNEIVLTSLEWRIINTLLNSIGNIVTREKLLDACDIRGNYINDNSLTVYIKRLRKKIEDDINNPKIIKTIKGIGYKIENANNE